ncbi:hypothetical protein FSW04_12970 [Baekduia soli]|uniref:Sulfocyanin-like C-terminal domain-containing protein n=1 Tax=Baekduia soli TaxID=496014 RepID=A0A5B8U5U0_9ACTN|nr:sulfocyanin-like copper-binding protein [Baekduia soli]QEC48390.1 hypothetical protein FSW04_12970 [Baekduia soli]
MSILDRRRLPLAGACLATLAAGGLTACGGGSSSTAATPATSAASSPSAATTTAAATTAATTAAAAPAAATTGASSVAATLSEFKIVATPATARAGRVTFHVTNAGKVKHQFTVIATSKPAARVLSRHNPDDDIPGARGEIASIAPGASKTLVIKHLKAGHYAIVCALPGHYQAGMYTDFTVK